MSKKTDLKFANVDKFLQENPHFAVTKPVPNYAAIRAVLRAGQVIPGVEIVEIESEAPPTENVKKLKDVIASKKD